MKNPVVFTDLDGTLLDHATYSWEPARPALRLLHDREIPLVFCSSKTRAEVEYYRRQLNNSAPFVTENGGGIFIPEGYFDLSPPPPELSVMRTDGYLVIRLGAPYRLLRQTVRELREEGFAVTGFGDMTAAEVATLTGLPPEQAVLAKARDFDEPFLFDGDSFALETLAERVRAKGLCLTRGMFHHLLGQSDKGAAVAILTALFRQKYSEIRILALGDSPNDLPMLKRADCPVAVRKPDGSHDRQLDLPNLIRTTAIGPAGWNEAIFQLLDRNEEI